MKYLGVDFGLRRIGLAVSEGELASPYKIIEIKSLKEGVSKIIKEILDEGMDKVVVGMPEGETGKSAVKFIKSLKSEGLDVVEADETLSSVNAIDMMIRSGVPRSKRRFTDAHAAAEILQNYLDKR